MPRIFYREELKDIAAAVLALTLIFWLAGGDYDIFLLPAFLLIVIVAFLFHELAHRWMAMRFGYIAFFKIFLQGILFGILFSLFGFVVVAPGAVMIYPTHRAIFKSPRRLRREWGLIAAAGPIVNLAFGLLFSHIALMRPNLLAAINIWLAFFNLFPIPPLDGSKVLAWSWKVWLVLMACDASLLYLYVL